MLTTILSVITIVVLLCLFWLVIGIAMIWYVGKYNLDTRIPDIIQGLAMYPCFLLFIGVLSVIKIDRQQDGTHVPYSG